jgi:pyruvate dehydrogenase E1 component
MAANEGLDNLTFVVNCNLQRLDGPVRGNGKIIQELESFFRGAGWNVIKVVWGREWDDLLAADTEGALVNLMNAPRRRLPDLQGRDGAVRPGELLQPRPAHRGKPWSRTTPTRRSGSSSAAATTTARSTRPTSAATEHKGQPTVILAKTIKGWTLGSHFEGRNATHQMKKLTLEDLKAFRDRCTSRSPTTQLDDPYLPAVLPPRPGAPPDPVHAGPPPRTRRLAARAPQKSRPSALPDDTPYEVVTAKGSGKQQVATTMAFVRLFKDLLRTRRSASGIVPIIPDEARTFGMDAMFPCRRSTTLHGQNYTSVDPSSAGLQGERSTVRSCTRASTRRARGLVQAAGTSYATHDEPMIPVYIFYSMFGFQRTGDSSSGRRRPDGARLPHRRHRRAAPRSPARACSTRTGTRRCWPRPTRRSWPTTRPSPTRSRTS